LFLFLVPTLIYTDLDSEDEAEDEEEKLKPTPKKTALKTSARSAQKDEGAEPTSASTYFAATGKNKVNRTIPVRESKSKSKPKPKVVVTPPSKKKAYVDVHDNDPADDIFVEEYKKQSDDYHDDPNDEDMDGFLVPDEDLRPKQRSGNSMKKRKQVVSDDDEYDVPSKGKPPKATAKKPRAPPKKKQEVVDNSEAQKIHDAVPTVRVPSPVVQDDSKKFNFRDVVRRPGPVAEGSKDLPTGEENCLAGLTFVFTGILQSLSREDGQQLVKKYGGKVTTAPSRKTSYVVLGSDAGPKKLETIRAQNIKTIDEDGLFQLIRSLPANGGDGKAAKEFEAKKALEEKKIREMAAEMERVAKADAIKAEEQGAPSKDVSQLWTVKYAPTSMAQICGNKGQVEKLQRWLRAWPKNLKTKFQLRGADGSGGYRAAMIHGAPGIGKTTAAHLVAKLEGYDILEYNASDTRSKKLMEETMRGVLDNSSLMGYFAPEKSKVDASKKKLVLIMDEVDGMSAGDRGGVGQLAMLCRKTSVSGGCCFAALSNNVLTHALAYFC
jgi:replication factor C subunit 1